MPKFEVYELEDGAYNNLKNLQAKIRTKNIKGHEKQEEKARERLNEMLKYTPVQETFNSWSELRDYLDNSESDTLVWRETGDLETQEYCSKCGAKANTNSEGRLRHLKRMHDIQVCPEDKYLNFQVKTYYMEVEYITEKRGGFDEWSDTYEAIVGVKIAGMNLGKKRFFNEGRFVDKNGDLLEVNIPGRKSDHITVQSSGRSYDFKKVGRSQFEKNIEEANQEKIVVDYENLEEGY